MEETREVRTCKACGLVLARVKWRGSTLVSVAKYPAEAPMHLAGSRELLFMICETCNKATATAADRWMENHVRERARPLPRSF